MLIHEVLTIEERSVLLASIIADGEITKCYPNSRRKNNSYREHFSLKQTDYRRWKQKWLSKWLYFSKKGDILTSKSHPLFTELYPNYYNSLGVKDIPFKLIADCNIPLFLSVLYMDDGSLCISKRVNHRKKLIYLTPHVVLYLQAYTKETLELLQCFIKKHTSVDLRLSKRKDGNKFVLKSTTVKETIRFLSFINTYTSTCPSMYYKTSWDNRFHIEKEKLHDQHQNYDVIASNSERFQDYTEEEILRLILMRKDGYKLKEIAKALTRSYWSVVYKVSELKKSGQLESS